jgi:hypothetical protein
MRRQENKRKLQTWPISVSMMEEYIQWKKREGQVAKGAVDEVHEKKPRRGGWKSERTRGPPSYRIPGSTVAQMLGGDKRRRLSQPTESATLIMMELIGLLGGSANTFKAYDCTK